MIFAFNWRYMRLRKIPGRSASVSLLFLMGLVCGQAAWPQQQPWSQRMANSAIERWPQGLDLPDTPAWNNDLSLLLIHFNNALSHHVIGDDFPAGQIAVNDSGPIFHGSHLLYMKDTCAISLKAPAKSLLEDRGDVVMAMAKYGKGTAFAVVDPWLYNEYTDGRKKPPEQDNYAAGKELVRWLLEERQR